MDANTPQPRRAKLPALLLPILFIMLLAPLARAQDVTQTKVWINTVTGYSQLATCAVYPLSVVVRDMSSGCGDGGRLTSYTCFCTDSYSKMTSIISTAVVSQCGNATNAVQQASSALDVFDGYCALGVESGLKPTSISSGASQSATATPAASSALPSQTGTSSNSSSSSSSSSSHTTAIAAGVAVPLGTIALAIGAFFIYRAGKRARTNNNPHAETGEAKGPPPHEADAGAVNGNAVEEMSPDYAPVEVSGEPPARYELSGGEDGGAREKDGREVVAEMDDGVERR